MKKIVLIFLCLFSAAYGDAKAALEKQYIKHCCEYSDIYEHLPVLRQLASECSTVVEIGLRGMVSSWGLLQGLADNPSPSRSYIGIDIYYPPAEILYPAMKLSEGCGISFEFWNANDMDIEIEPTELLFIDSLHTYCHLSYELEKFSPYVSKYIAMHDTSAPWGNMDDDAYQGDYSEYPSHYDRNKKGLWPAVEDFLAKHPEWILFERHLNNHGFTILKRKTN
jgi:hypothetical protein